MKNTPKKEKNLTMASLVEKGKILIEKLFIPSKEDVYCSYTKSVLGDNDLRRDEESGTN